MMFSIISVQQAYKDGMYLRKCRDGITCYMPCQLAFLHENVCWFWCCYLYIPLYTFGNGFILVHTQQCIHLRAEWGPFKCINSCSNKMHSWMHTIHNVYHDSKENQMSCFDRMDSLKQVKHFHFLDDVSGSNSTSCLEVQSWDVHWKLDQNYESTYS